MNEARTLRVLLVEDSPVDVALVTNLLGLVTTPLIQVASAQRLDEALALLARERFDVILLDLMMPDSAGLDALDRVSAQAADVPIVVLTGVDDESVALEALRRGAEDYLLKREGINESLLVRTIRYAVQRKQAELQIRRLNAELEQRVAARTSELAKSEQRYRSVVEDQTEFIVRWLPDGTQTFVNDAFCRYCGRTREELLGTSVLPLRVHATEREAFQRRVAALTPEQPLSQDEHFTVAADGSTRWQRWTDRALFDEQGQLVELQSVGRDITEYQLAQAALRRAERLASIGTMAAGIAHEINNPIAAVLNSAEAAQRFKHEPQAAPLLDKCLHNVVRSARRCQQIVENVLKFARQEPTDRARCRLNDLVRTVRETILPEAQQQGVEIVLDLADDLPDVFVNALGVEQVLGNLLRNAIQASPATTAVLVRTRKTHSGVRLIVEDHGQGMTPEQRERAFDPFYSTRQHESGTGLGLSIAHGIVRGHGGTIEINSEVGRGTSVTVDLPSGDPDAMMEHPRSLSP